MSESRTAFITGATGFVGSAVARVLLAEGWTLRALARHGSNRRNLHGLKNLTVVEGDLLNIEAWSDALENCAALFHVAADYRIWVPDVDAMNRVNIDGTQALMDAAMRFRIPRIVYTSSVATLGHVPGDGAADEDTPVTLDDMIGVYKRSKFLAEQEVQSLIQRHGLPCVIVNPSTPIGPRDIKPTPTGRIIVEAMRGHMPAYVDTGLNVAHVDDVAMGHWLAFERGEIGQRYILGGDNLGLGDILGIVAVLAKRKPPVVKLPRGVLYPVAVLAEAIARRTGQEPMLTVDALTMAKKKMFFTSEKAERLLGYTPRPAQDAIRDAITWFRAGGYC